MTRCRLAKLFVITLTTFIVVMLLGHSAHAEMRIFTLQHKPAAELVEMVRQLVSENARVAAHRHTLVVNSTPAEIEEVARLVESFDRAQVMLRITVDQDNINDSTTDTLVAGARIRSDSLRVNVGQPAQSDSRVVVRLDDGSVSVSGHASSSTEKRHVSQFLNVMDGSPAYITVGRAIPFTSELRYYSRRHPRFIESIEYRNVDTGFEVLPEVNGNMVNLEIRPFMHFLDPQNDNQIVFHDLATKVRVPLGTWYDLGGLAEGYDDLSREILLIGSGSGNQTHKVRIRVDSGY